MRLRRTTAHASAWGCFYARTNPTLTHGAVVHKG
jgi:hypothetical protein